MMKEENCGNCRFSRAHEVRNAGTRELELRLQCQRHSPSTWAFVKDNDWCGDWEWEWEPVEGPNEIPVHPDLQESMGKLMQNEQQPEPPPPREGDIRCLGRFGPPENKRLMRCEKVRAHTGECCGFAGGVGIGFSKFPYQEPK